MWTFLLFNFTVLTFYITMIMGVGRTVSCVTYVILIHENSRSIVFIVLSFFYNKNGKFINIK